MWPSHFAHICSTYDVILSKSCSPSFFEGRLQLEADRHTQSIKKRDTQVKSLASFLELEGYERTPLNERQLQSFHRQVNERLDQDKEALSQTMVWFE